MTSTIAPSDQGTLARVKFYGFSRNPSYIELRDRLRQLDLLILWAELATDAAISITIVPDESAPDLPPDYSSSTELEIRIRQGYEFAEIHMASPLVLTIGFAITATPVFIARVFNMFNAARRDSAATQTFIAYENLEQQRLRFILSSLDSMERPSNGRFELDRRYRDLISEIASGADAALQEMESFEVEGNHDVDAPPE